MVEIDKRKRIDLKKVFSGANLSLILVVVFASIVLGNIIFGSVYYSSRVIEGDISLRTVYAPYDFEYPSTINESETEEMRKRIRLSVPPVFYIDNSFEENAINNLKIFFSGLNSIGEAEDEDAKNIAIETVKKDSGINVSDNIISYFSKKENCDKVKTDIEGVLTSIYPLGIVDTEMLKEHLQGAEFIKIKNDKLRSERLRAVGDVLTVEAAKDVGKEYLTRVFPRDSKLRSATIDLISGLIRPNLLFNQAEAEKARDEAVKNAPPIYDMVEVKKNELLLERGKRVTRQNIAQLKELGIIGGVSHKGPYVSGMLLLIMLLLLLGVWHLFIVEEKLIKKPKEIATILITSLFIIMVGQVVIQSPQPSYVIPLSGVAMLITLLVSSNAGFLSTLLLSLFLGVVSGGKLEVALVLLVGGFASIYVVRDARRRSKIILAGITAGAVSALCIISMGLINNLEPNVYLLEALWGLGSGLIAIFLVMGALPLFEYGFKMTTNITLLELSDLNHPLLKELTFKAPGTYQHSIMVGNLAEAACDAIGANSLLARVGSYYHDIGKIEKAEYFSENEMGAQSKHEKLTPSMSSLIIVNHVKDGVDLAKKYKLNPKISEFIEQHHGTGLIYYFYQRALEKAGEDHELDDDEFRYPGPRPQTKESAIVLLADSVEASSRTLSDPTPARIMGLVQKIINNKFIDNQLSECDLTLKDLNKIASSFVRVLTAVFHTRLEYPDRKNVTVKKINGKNKHHQPKQK